MTTILAILALALLFALFGLLRPTRSCDGHCGSCTGECPLEVSDPATTTESHAIRD